MDESVTITEEDLQTRSSYLCKIASEKKFSFGWEDMESHFELFNQIVCRQARQRCIRRHVRGTTHGYVSFIN